MRPLFLALALAFGCTTTDLGAVDNAATSAGPDGGGASDESTAACDGKAAGDACSFTARDGATVTATCQPCGPSGPLMCGQGPMHAGDAGHHAR